MNIRTMARTLTLSAMLGIAVIGVPATGVHADRIGPGVPPQANKPCYIPGSDVPHITGEKATFSQNGQPAAEHTCQKDGTWSARLGLTTSLPVAPISVGAIQ